MSASIPTGEGPSSGLSPQRSPSGPSAATKLPATVVTGFLGSGKTTLLRHVLTEARGRRIAVIVNEFGSLGIAGAVLREWGLGCDEGGAVDGVIELANGCLCCTVQEEFFPVMRELAQRREQLDHLLIETSGLALPKPLVQAFNWPEIKAAFTVDAVVTVVDGPAVAAGQFAADPDAVATQRSADPNLDHASTLQELFEDQLGSADLVVINKVDQLDTAARSALGDRLQGALPPAVKRVEASYGQLALEVLLGLGHAAEDHIHHRRDHHGEHHGDEHHHHHGHEHHGHEHHGHHHHHAFDTAVVTLPEVDGAALQRALEALVADHALYRIKGFVAVPGKPMRQVIQGVGRRFERYFDRRWLNDEPRLTQLVFIGFDLDEATLERQLRAHLPGAL
ncbi:MAG: cobalamin biosynthesis protein CobW [Candidatus Competibacterales bacterium]